MSDVNAHTKAGASYTTLDTGPRKLTRYGRLRTPVDRVLRPVVNRGVSVLRPGHGYLGRGCSAVARTVSHLEGNRVDAAIAAAHSFRHQLN